MSLARVCDVYRHILAQEWFIAIENEQKQSGKITKKNYQWSPIVCTVALCWNDYSYSTYSYCMTYLQLI